MKFFLMTGWTLLLFAAMVTNLVYATDPSTITIGDFSAMRPGTPIADGWEAFTFDKIDATTRYRLVDTDGRTVVRADSMASASGLTRSLSINPEHYPCLK